MRSEARAAIFLMQLRIMARVVTAVILRETKTRYGKSRFGYLMALVEPIGFIGLFIIIRTLIGRSIPFGESIVLFILTGLLTFRVFAAISGRVAGGISGNRALLAYPPVRAVDILVARLILEMLTMYFVVFAFFVGLALSTEREIMVSLPNFAGGLAAVTFLGFGLGVVNSVLFVLLPSWSVVFGILRLPLLISSGIFYVPKSMPVPVQEILWWNPLLHCVEWLRTGTYLVYDPLLTFWYPLSVSLFLLVVGLALERVLRYRIQAT